MPPAAVEDHFRAVTKLYRSMSREAGTGYIAPIERRIGQRHDPGMTGALFDDDEIIASYRTEERSIDPFVISTGSSPGHELWGIVTNWTMGVIRAIKELLNQQPPSSDTPLH